MHEQRPHVHRHDGEFALSQITADDVDLSRKLNDTKKRVHAYYMYDDLSQCVIGAATDEARTNCSLWNAFGTCSACWNATAGECPPASR